MITAITRYSQQNEQDYILAHTPEIGRFLEIGAWNAKEMSNTRALYEAGWSGIMIEPSPLPFDGLLREYGNDERITLINGAVGFERGLGQIHVTADAVSTMDAGVHALWKDRGGYYGKFYTPRITLEDLFNQFGGDFDFVNIDAEGMSVELFLRLLKIGPRPACLCIEHDGKLVQAQMEAAAAGYRAVHVNDTNVVFAI